MASNIMIRSNIGSTTAGPGNLAQIQHCFGAADTPSLIDLAMALTVAFWARTGPLIAGETSVVNQEIQIENAPLVPTTFPVATYATLRTANPSWALPVMTGYGVSVGSNTGLTVRGTSILVKQANALGGRHNGRQFLPWVKEGALISGALSPTIAGQVATIYNEVFFGLPAVNNPQLVTRVNRTAVDPGGQTAVITGVQVRTRLSMIRSRRQ